ncbi:MAG: hypothetical protein RL108_863 [Bacteroidota bacterium]|jgi:hypothetical protein
MRIDLTSLSFNSILEEGVGTPSWGTALGQSEGYYITVDGANDLLLGLFNNKIDDSLLEHNFRGEKKILLAACFSRVFINKILIDKPLILAVVEENSQSHSGRKSLKYNDKIKYLNDSNRISNQDFFEEAQNKIGKNTCWFGYEMNILNGKDLEIKSIIVSDSPVTYLNSRDRKESWNNLMELTSNSFSENRFTDILVKNKVIGQFVFEVLSYLNSEQNLNPLIEYLVLNSDNRFMSLVKDDLKLTSIFKLFDSIATEAQLTSGEKLRFFSTHSFEKGNQKYYLSKEWTGSGDTRLDINHFSTIFNSIYNNMSIIKKGDDFCLINSKKKFDLPNFIESCKLSGLIFSPKLINRFVASLCTKPFVICSGLSGSGKTKLAQAFVQWISYDESQYLIVPVGADWTNREPLLGYPNALTNETYVAPENGVLDLILRAKENFHSVDESTKPYFLILDEMNLSHVERYFADFLSAMESGDKIPLHKMHDSVSDIPSSFNLPKNLFIIGTVNIDETTYMFSPKVLDRANTIEFRLSDQNLEDYIDCDIKLNLEILKGHGASMSESFMELALIETDKNLSAVESDLKLFFSELKKSGAEFGYRTANEIGRLMYMLTQSGENGNDLLDIAIMQKLLPKLHGSRNKLTKVLPVLGSFCVINSANIKEEYLDKFVANLISENDIEQDSNVKYHISLEKICRMYKNAIENGFASYAEA